MLEQLEPLEPLERELFPRDFVEESLFLQLVENALIDVLLEFHVQLGIFFYNQLESVLHSVVRNASGERKLGSKIFIGLFESFHIILLEPVLEDGNSFALIVHELVGCFGVSHHEPLHYITILRHERTPHCNRGHRVISRFELVQVAQLVHAHAQRLAEFRVRKNRGIERFGR